MMIEMPEQRFDLRRLLKPQGIKRGFETVLDARKEDDLRVKALRQCREPSTSVSPKGDGISKKMAGRVASKIVAKAITLASSRYMRGQRLRWIGAVLNLAARQDTDRLRVFTLVPNRGWSVSGNDLASVDPKRLLARFRQQLVRLGIGRSSGWCIVYLHGEYDPVSDSYQLHLHALAAGGAVAILRKLCLRPMFRPAHSGAKVLVKRPSLQQPWRDPPRQASYLAQGFWPSKPTYLNAGKTYRNRQRQRIPDPRFAEYLVWLDQQSFRDFVLLFGCEIADGRLVPTRRRRRVPKS